MSAPEKIFRSETRSPTHVIYYGEDRRVGENITYIRSDIHEAEIDALKAENQSIKIHVAELRKENSRYEFLRQRASDEEWPEWCTWEMLGEAEGDEWDALIDRLMDEY